MMGDVRFRLFADAERNEGENQDLPERLCLPAVWRSSVCVGSVWPSIDSSSVENKGQIPEISPPFDPKIKKVEFPIGCNAHYLLK